MADHAPNPSTHAAPTLWARTKEVVGEALELSGAKRDAFVEAACVGDPALLSEVRALLSASTIATRALDDAGIPADAIADAVHAPPVAHGAMVGRYRVERPLGSGGMGAVFEATDSTLNRRVALKLLTMGLASSGARRRFEGEAATLARLDHPGIARVYEAGVHLAAGQAVSVPFFAMEFVEGARTLDVHLREERPDLRSVLALFARVCDAVHHGHQKSVLHRDLKPGNILVQQDGTPRVIDFGIARLLDHTDAQATRTQQPSHATRAGDMLGTPAYLPPEAFEQGPQAMDTRGDVYALGVVLYEALAQRNPFAEPGLTPVQTGRLVAGKSPPLLGTVRTDCAGDVETIVATAMAREPQRRYASMEQFGADLRRVLAYEPILARPTPLLRQAALFAKRRRGLMAGAGLVALALAVGVVGLGVGLARARESERRARAEAERATQVSTFVMRMLRSASPFPADPFSDAGAHSRLFDESEAWPSTATPGRAPSVGDLLAAATSHLDESFPHDPALQADMAEALCVTAGRMSDPRIEVFTQRAADLLERAYGRNDVRTLTARMRVYANYLLNGSSAFLPDAEHDLATIRALPQPANDILLRSAWGTYLGCLRAQDRALDAVPMLRTIRSDLDRVSPADSFHKVALDTAIILAETTDARAGESVLAMAPLLARARALPQPDADRATLDVLFNLQAHQANAGASDAAMHTLAQGIALSTRTNGGQDQGTYEWWNNLYAVALRTANLDVAEYAAREQVRASEAMLGAQSLYTTKANGRLARSLLAQGKSADEAERAARKAVESSPDLLAKGDGWVLYHEVIWAWSIRAGGDAQRAKAILEHRIGIETQAGRPHSIAWVEILRSTELANCELDLARAANDLPARRATIDAHLRHAELCAGDLPPDWPSVPLLRAARARADAAAR
jgi:serine/threonine protein kinase